MLNVNACSCITRSWMPCNASPVLIVILIVRMVIWDFSHRLRIYCHNFLTLGKIIFWEKTSTVCIYLKCRVKYKGQISSRESAHRGLNDRQTTSEFLEFYLIQILSSWDMNTFHFHINCYVFIHGLELPDSFRLSDHAIGTKRTLSWTEHITGVVSYCFFWRRGPTLMVCRSLMGSRYLWGVNNEIEEMESVLET